MIWLSENAETIKLVATLIGIAGGLLGFFKFYDQKQSDIADRKKKRGESLELEREKAARARQASDRAWLQAALHQIFHESETPDLAFDELFEKVIGSAYMDEAVELTKSSFNRKYLRRLLVEMISKGVIEQTAHDVYSLKLRVLSQQDILSRTLIENNAAADEIIRVVRNSPQTYNSRGLVDQLKNAGISLSQMQFEVLLKQLEEQFNLITRDDAGKWMPLN